MRCVLCACEISDADSSAHVNACVIAKADAILAREGKVWPLPAVDALHPSLSGCAGAADSGEPYETTACEILPGLFIGGRGPGVSTTWLRSHDIRVVVDCADAAEGRTLTREDVDDAGLLVHVHLGLEDRWPGPRELVQGSTEPLSESYRTRIMVGANAVQEARIAGRRVLVHCIAGRSRSATVLFAALMREGMTLLEAVSLVRARRRVAPVLGFWRLLVALDAELHGGRHSIPVAALALHRESIVENATMSTAPPMALAWTPTA